MRQDFVFAIASLLTTALLTWRWIKIARAKQIHDHPERRRLHEMIVPRAGGVGIAVVMVFAAAAALFYSPGNAAVWTIILVALVLYAVLGFRDDLKPLQSGRKLFFHLLAAAIIFCVGNLDIQSSYFHAGVLALAYLLFVNFSNFMDGSNGMLGMQGLICAIGFAVLSTPDSQTYGFAVILAASCLGFLPFNFPHARVFPGDVGSHVLGASLISLALLAYAEAQWTLLEAACLLSGLWIDALLTLIRRGWRGYRVTRAHSSHLYQYAIRQGKSHTVICIYYLIWTAIAILVIAACRHLPVSDRCALLISLLVAGCAIHQWLRLSVLKSVHIPKSQSQ